MSRWGHPGLLALILFCITTRFASADTLTLRGAWVRLAEYGPEYAVAKHRHEAAENNYRSKRLGFYLPRLSFDFTVPAYSRDESTDDIPTGDTLNPYTRALVLRETTNLTGGLSLSQAVLTGGQLSVSGQLWQERRLLNLGPDFRSRWGGLQVQFSQPLFKPSQERGDLRRSQFELSRADIEFGQARWNSLISVTRAYADWLAAIRGEELAALSAEKSRFEANAAQAKYESGTLKESDLIQRQSDRFDAEIAYLDAAAARKDAEVRLAALIDWPAGDSLLPADSLLDLGNVLGHRPAAPSGSDSLAAVETARLELESRKFALAEQKSQGGIDGTLNANWSTQQEDETSLDTDRKTTFNTGRWGVNLEVSVPIWDGGAQGAAVQSAQLAVEEAEANYKKARREAENALVSARRKFETLERKLDLKRQEVAIARQGEEHARSKYADGLLSDADHLQAKITAAQAAKDYLETKRDYIVAYLDLQNLFVNTRPPL
jgi:outer membrane protein TolC